MFYIIWVEVALFSNYFGYEISWDNIKSRIPNIDARSRDLLTTNMRHFRMRSFFNFFLRVSQIHLPWFASTWIRVMNDLLKTNPSSISNQEP